jgi:hypothetical protein
MMKKSRFTGTNIKAEEKTDAAKKYSKHRKKEKGAVPANIEICYVGQHEKEQIKQTHSV